MQMIGSDVWKACAALIEYLAKERHGGHDISLVHTGNATRLASHTPALGKAEGEIHYA